MRTGNRRLVVLPGHTLRTALCMQAELWEPARMKGGGRRRMRRPGAIVLILLFGGAALALALTLRYHLGVAGVVGVVVALLLGLPGLYLGWVPLKQAQRRSDRSLAQIADGLAGRLRSQWEREAEARRLNDPYPLPVAWTAAHTRLAGDLDALKTLAAGGFGWSAPAPEYWAKGPEDLAGGGARKLADVLAKVPTGRLVVLGEPGSGKTMLMVGLVLDLLDPNRRSSGGPVPVLASLASWDPVSQDLHGWLGATLITSYPDLAGAPPPDSAGGNCFEALVEARLILPILDGLDEIAESARPVAIGKINEALKPGEQVVVTCRTEQYRAAVSPHDGHGAALRAAAVQLFTLEFGEVASYLRKDAEPARGHWDFLDTLSAESPVRQALATPLMAGLARAIYNPRPGERAKDLRDPAELCNYPDRPAVETHLLDAFLPAAYRSRLAGGHWTAEQAEPWLGFLASHLEQTAGSPDIAWWQLRRAMPGSTLGSTLPLVIVVVSGLVAGIETAIGAATGSGIGTGWEMFAFGLAGLMFGLAGLMFGLTARMQNTEAPSRGVRPTREGLQTALSFGLSAMLMLGLVFGFRAGHKAELESGLQAGLRAGLGTGLVIGLVAGLVTTLGFGLVFGLGAVPGDAATAASPRAVLTRDRQAALLLMLGLGLVFGLGGLVAGLWPGLGAGPRLGLGGFVFGFAAGFVSSWTQTMWPFYMVTRGWLAFHHRLPWPLMSFLVDAHRRGVLRQAGAVYQFRHIELQQRLAARS
jgi:NACHT domain